MWKCENEEVWTTPYYPLNKDGEDTRWRSRNRRNDGKCLDLYSLHQEPLPSGMATEIGLHIGAVRHQLHALGLDPCQDLLGEHLCHVLPLYGRGDKKVCEKDAVAAPVVFHPGPVPIYDHYELTGFFLIDQRKIHKIDGYWGGL